MLESFAVVSTVVRGEGKVFVFCFIAGKAVRRFV
jgi:hypothetical protein